MDRIAWPGERKSDTRKNHQTTPGPGMVRLDAETNNRLLQTHKRRGRSQASEAALRLKDHLERFPDFIIQNA